MKLKRFNGLNNVDDPMDVGLKGLQRARNVDIDRNGKVASRQGATKIQSESIIASWHDKSNLLVLNAAGELKALIDGQMQKIQDMAGERLAATEVNNLLYVSTDKETCVIDGVTSRPMGVPHAEVVASYSAGGNLKKGRYQVNATAVHPDGRESGAMDSFLIDVPDDSQIHITAATTTGYTIKLYVSGADGEQLYHVADGANATISSPDDTLGASEVLDRLYKGPMPEVSIMDEYQSCLLGAAGNILFASDPLDYELFDYVESVIPFDDQITMVRSVGTGIFVGTESATHFIAGEAPGQWFIRESYRYGVTRGSDQIVDMSKVGQGSAGKGVIFLTDQGICLGTADGAVTNITERKVLIPRLNGVSSMLDGSRYVLAIQ